MNSMIRSVLLFLLLVPLALAFLGPLKANFAFSSSSRSGGLFASTTTNTAIEQKKANLVALLEGVQPNGVYATAEQRKAVDTAARELERLNPTKNPAYSDKMNGFWRLLYSDFSEKGSSGGKLGPFVGEVYQDLDSKVGRIKNLIRVRSITLKGGLQAKQTVKDANTWQIEFLNTASTLLGFLPFQKKVFPPGEFIRLWKITYLDDDFRILRARRPETSEDKAYIFILRRDEPNRFQVKFD